METRSINECFKMNKEIYEKYYLPYYEGNPKKLIQFCIILPYYFPIEDNKAITLSKEDYYLSFSFEKKYKDESYLYNISPEDDYNVKKAISKIEMTYVENNDIDRNLKEYISDCFDELLKSLNDILLAYKIRNKDKQIYMIRKEMLATVIIYRIVDVKKWINEKECIFLINTNMPYDENILKEKELSDLMRHCNIVMNELNPFINTVDYLINANRLLSNGFYEDSVINANIAVESYIRNLYKYFITFENPQKSDEEIEEILNDMPFMTILKKEICNRLGGRWDVTQKETEIGQWYINTYILRNRIVHGTRKINYNQAKKSWQSANECIKYIKTLVLDKKNKYPTLSEYFA